MPSKYTPAIFQPTIRPSWAGALPYIPQEEKSLILEAIFKYPNQECDSLYWRETIKPDLDNQYNKFNLSCQAKGRASALYWENKGEDILSNSFPDGNQHKDKDKDKDKNKGKSKSKVKLTEIDIVDWETLFAYWEQNKSGGKYKNDDSRKRMLKILKKLTYDNLENGKKVIFDAIDHGWQGFCNNGELYYKGALKTVDDVIRSEVL